MLVLKVPVNRMVKVGGVEVKILEASGREVTLGFSGDKNVPIVRDNAKRKHGEEGPE